MFTVSLFIIYISLALVSAFTLRNYLRKNSYVDYNSIILAPLIPSVSVITPAFNESKNIIENVRALLALYYNDIEIIIDGLYENVRMLPDELRQIVDRMIEELAEK